VGWTTGRGRDCFLFATVYRSVLGPTQSLIKLVPGALSPGVKRPMCEADHSPPSSAEVKNAGRPTSTPPHVLMALSYLSIGKTLTFNQYHMAVVSKVWVAPPWGVGTDWLVRVGFSGDVIYKKLIRKWQRVIV
jgi:hypothetical protein